MTINNPYTQYFENRLKTTTPGNLIVITFDAAIRFANQAAEAMSSGNLEEQNTNIRKVQNILIELISSLDYRADRHLAANLTSLYSYAFDRLTHANISDDPKALAEATDLLKELRTTWAEAEKLVRSGGSSQASDNRKAA